MYSALLDCGLPRRGKLRPSHDGPVIYVNGNRNQISFIPTSASPSKDEIFCASLVHLSDDSQVLECGFKDCSGLVACG